jgi:ribosomal protein S27E
VRFIRLPVVVEEIGVDQGRALAMLSSATEEGILKAYIKVRCPECGQHEDTFESKSEVPKENVTCFSCDANFEIDDTTYWEVVYQLRDDVDHDFFQNVGERLRTFTDSSKDLPSRYFKKEFNRLKNLDGVETPQERGRYFDHFVGLLFAQIPGVRVTVKDILPRGEVDVFVDFVDGPDWLLQQVGNVTLIENKWEATPVGQSEISNFHDKGEDMALRTDCNTVYFVSMSGFTEGASRELIERRSPNIVGLQRKDIVQMVEEGSIESVLRHNVV